MDSLLGTLIQNGIYPEEGIARSINEYVPIPLHPEVKLGKPSTLLRKSMQ